jgi:hypothetical protein
MKILNKIDEFRILRKSSFKAFFAVLLPFVMTACEDQLNEEIPSEFNSSTFFADATTVEMGVMGIYDAVANEDFYSRWLSYELQGPTDISRFNRSNRDRGTAHGQVNDHIFTENNQAIAQVWTQGYKAVYAANLAIDGTKPLYESLKNTSGRTGVQESQFETIGFNYAEAHFLRAVVYFEMVKKWGDIPLKLSSATSLSETEAIRTPQEEVYEQIEKDLQFAIEHLPWASSGIVGRANKGAALGLLTRVYLAWAGQPISDQSKYAKAVETAKQIIDSREHALLTKFERIPDVPAYGAGPEYADDYPELWWNFARGITDETEVMWSIHHLYTAAENDCGWIGAWYGVHTGDKAKGGPGRGDNRMPLTWDFYDSFEESDSIRRDYTCFPFRSYTSGGENFWEPLPRSGADNRTPYYRGLGVGKYRRYLMPVVSENNNKESMDWPVIRYADVLLMYAEAQLMSGGDLDDGLDKLNMVRRRAHKLPIHEASSIDKQVLNLDVIINERAWELAGEGLRKHDLIRWGILVERIKAAGAAYEVRWPNHLLSEDGHYLVHTTIQDHHVLWPIPFSAEIAQNPKILETDPTNNGYR